MTLKFDKQAEHDVSWICENPIAHRGLHDACRGIYENTLPACAAAVDKGFAMEVDLQPSGDGIPMVFHDYDLERMTGIKGDIRKTSCEELRKISILHTDHKIPTLSELLALVDGTSNLVLELKGQVGADEGFVKAVARDLNLYRGNAAIMSFHHHILEDARLYASHLPLGLTAKGDQGAYDEHKKIAENTNVDFLSYELKNLDTAFVHEFNETGRPIISWTVKSKADALFSDRFAAQPTFEGFLP